mmetsp:Transcript_148/g.245  ORF Transcript_148/g.245 Transcript_148/m.245 type:complete len:224 (-) Transcript_148:886-1557(-)
MGLFHFLRYRCTCILNIRLKNRYPWPYMFLHGRFDSGLIMRKNVLVNSLLQVQIIQLTGLFQMRLCHNKCFLRCLSSQNSSLFLGNICLFSRCLCRNLCYFVGIFTDVGNIAIRAARMQPLPVGKIFLCLEQGGFQFRNFLLHCFYFRFHRSRHRVEFVLYSCFLCIPNQKFSLMFFLELFHCFVCCILHSTKIRCSLFFFLGHFFLHFSNTKISFSLSIGNL